jgi:DNA-binding transcriptional LysR family regulator
MDITLDQLAVLDAIDRTGSFAGAAAELHRVPSAVSYAVKGLEAALEVEVFDRSRRRAELTPAGRRVLEHARDVLEHARSLERLAVELRGGWEPELHVVVDGALPMRPVSRCLKRFAAADVPTRLRVDVEYQEGVVHRFARDLADVALLIGFAGDGDEVGFEARPLAPLELVLVVAPGHPLAGGPTTEAERAVFAELIVRDSSPDYARRPKRSFLGSENVAHLSDFYSKRVALLEGAGFGWIPLHLVAADLAGGELVMLEVEGPSTFTYHPQLVTRTGHRLGRGGELFVQTILGARAELP